jgi:hypothetical protein
MFETPLTPEILLANNFTENEHGHFVRMINNERFILRKLGDDYNWIVDDNIPETEPYVYVPGSPIINSVEILNKLLIGLESKPIII